MKARTQLDKNTAEIVANEALSKHSMLMQALADAQVRHDSAVARRAVLQREMRKLDETLSELAGEERTATKLGRPVSEQVTQGLTKGAARADQLSADLATLAHEVQKSSADLVALQTEASLCLFGAGSLADVGEAQRQVDNATAALNEIDEVIRQVEADCLSAKVAATPSVQEGETLAAVLAKAALGEASPVDVEKIREDVKQRTSAASEAGSIAAGRMAEQSETLAGLRARRIECVAALERSKAGVRIALRDYLGAEAMSVAQAYASNVQQLTQLLGKMAALDTIIRRFGLQPLLNENWPSCFALPSVRRDVAQPDLVRPHMPGLLVDGLVLTQPKARERFAHHLIASLSDRGITLN